MKSTTLMRSLAVLVAACLVGVSSAVCQQAPADTTSAQNQSSASGSTTSSDPQNADATAANPQNNADSQNADSSPSLLGEPNGGVHALSTGRIIEPGVPPKYHLGPVGLLSMDLQQVYDINQPDGGAGISSTGTLFQANFAANFRILRRSMLTFQYQPQLMVVDGSFVSGLANHNGAFNLAFPITRRMQLQVSDTMSHYSPRSRLFSGGGMTSDVASNYLNQTDFVQRTNGWTSNSTQVSVLYDLSARNRLTVSPIVGYLFNSGNTQANWGRQLGATVSFDRKLDARTTLGGEYSYVSTSYDSSLPSSQYNSFGLTFAREFGRGWALRGAARASTMLTSNRQHWAPYPKVSLIKAFRRSSIAVAYTRSNSFGSSLKNGYTDQVDAQYSRQITNRFQIGLGGGNYGELLTGQGTSAKYGSASLSVGLRGGMSWSTSFMYMDQSGNALNTMYGTRMLIRSGITWAPQVR